MTITEVRPTSGADTDETRLRAVLEPLLAAATGRAGSLLVSASIPVAPLDPVSLFAASMGTDDEPMLLLEPNGGSALVGIGHGWTVEASGAERFSVVADSWARRCEGAITSGGGAMPAVGPVLVGGFGFGPETAGSNTWRGFERARFVLPELCYVSTPGAAWLTLSLTQGVAGPARLDAALDRWRRLLDTTEERTSGPASVTLRLAGQSPEPEAWRDSVARIAGAVGRGRIDKAVLSRQVRLRASHPIHVPTVLRRLAAAAPETTVFAVSRGPRMFLGATPELLVSLRGRDVRTVAMAGSTRRGGDVASDSSLATAMLQSDKEREEHAIVVTALRDALAPITSRLDIGVSPSVAPHRYVQHLVTAMTGRLREQRDVLDLVARLHPTPAVGGAPRDLALELIAEEEPHERGWYAGPLGWVDGRGDGDFVVALRSGVIEGPEATLFAGCGIVADSDPDREWDESSAKLLSLSTALGRIEA